MKDKSKSDLYKQVQRFAEVTKVLLASGKMKRAKLCLQIAEDIFVNGTNEIKNVISNIYVFSVSSYMEINHCDIHGLLPYNLQKEYYNQVNASGI